MKKNELKKMTKKELIALARSKKIRVTTRMLKADLVDTIYKAIRSGKPEKAAAGAPERKKRRSVKRPSSKKTARKKPKKSAPASGGPTIRQKAVAGKYFLKKHSTPDLIKNETSNLPEYDITRIVCMVRDPHWIFAYWKISSEEYNALKRRFGSSLENFRTVLRVYEDSGGGKKHFDIDIPDDSKNWYINVSERCRYRVGIGMISPDGIYEEIALSDTVETPPEGASKNSDEKWFVSDTAFNEIISASGDLKEKTGSEEYLKAEKNSSIDSETVSSFSGNEKGRSEDPRPSIKMELVVYGAAGKNSRINLLGKDVEPNEDGSFSIRMALPEGEFELPVKLVSSDGKLEKTVKAEIKTETS